MKSPVAVRAAEGVKTAQEILELAERAKISLANHVAVLAREQVCRLLKNRGIVADTMIVSRDGRIIGRAPA